MKVQRGVLSLLGNDLSSEVLLDYPVPVGNSFVVSSVRIEPDFWVEPETHVDWENEWGDEELAYDGDVDTYAFTGSNEFLEFPFEGITPVLKVRVRSKFVLADTTLGIPNIDIEVYSEEEWHNIYSGEVDNDEWEEIIPFMDFESIRIRFNNEFNAGDYGFLAELQLYYTAIDTLSSTLCRVDLSDISGDNYTKIKATRYSSNDHITTVEWQVIYGDEFNVQTGTIDCNDLSLTETQEITPVDLDKAFIIHTNYASDELASKGFFMSDFSSESEVVISRGYAQSGDVNSINCQVIEWSGATVHSYGIEMETDVVVVDVEEVNPLNTFLVSSYTEEGIEPLYQFSRGDILSSEEVSFTRYGVGNPQQISFFTVSHPDFCIYSGSSSISGLVDSVILDDLVSVNRSFVYTPQIGNASSDVAGFGTMFCGFNTHKLEQDGVNSVVTIERGNEDGELSYSYSVVGYETSLPTVTTDECTDFTFFSVKAHANLINDGGFDVSRRGFCYMRSHHGDPTVDDYTVYEDGLFDVGEYSLTVTGLNPSRTYRLRAYVVTMLGINYGETVTVTIESVPMSEFCGKEVEDIGFVNKYKTPRH